MYFFRNYENSDPMLLLVCTTAFAQPSTLEKELNDIYFSNRVYEIVTAGNNLYAPYRAAAKNALENCIAKAIRRTSA